MHSSEDRHEAELPPIDDYGRWLVDTAQEIGLSNVMGGLMQWSEIRAWSEEFGIQLTAWEVETVRHLSATYLAAADKYKDDKNAMPPYMSPEWKARLQAEQERKFEEAF